MQNSAQDLIGYDDIIENSMRSVIVETLKKVEKTGLPGNHHFIITFLTNFPDILVPQYLIEKYGEEMTIVLQHQFKNLIVERDCFKLTLSFKGRYERLSIPYKAITSFADPSMSFVLKFSMMSYGDAQDFESGVFNESNSANKNDDTQKTDPTVDLSAKVISIDAFRKNRNTNSDENS